MDSNSVKNYVELGRALQEKYDEIRRGIVTHRDMLQEQYKPLLEPLKEISTSLKTQRPITTVKVEEEGKKEKLTEKQIELLNSFGPIAYEYLGNANPSQRDTTFGIYIKEKRPYLGNLPIFIDDNIITVGGEKFMGTQGLWELLTLKEPKKYSHDDLEVYEHLILKSSAHRHHNDPTSPQVKSSSGNKYLKLIKPMLIRHNMLKNQQPSKSLEEEINETSTTGSGLRKILTNAPVEYVYWNDLNELLERLYIVYGSMKAGNKNNPRLYNEILSIVEELKEI